VARRRDRGERLASLGQFAAQITHEFNNALMGIQTSFEVVRRRVPVNDPQTGRAVRAIESALARSRQITADILEFGRLPRLELRPFAVDLRPALHDEKEWLRGSA